MDMQSGNQDQKNAAPSPQNGVSSELNASAKLSPSRVPLFGLGTYRLEGKGGQRAIESALEMGYRLLDTAQMYYNEEQVGRAVRNSKVPREEIFLITKLQQNQNVVQSVQDSLRKLDTDYVDLLLIHWVMGNDLQTWRIMEKLVAQGLVRSIGLSNFYGADFAEIVESGTIHPAVNQLECHIYRQNLDLLEEYSQLGVVLQAWSPFGAGQTIGSNDLSPHPVLTEIAAEVGASAGQVTLRYLMNLGISVIPRSRNPQHQLENLESMQVQLTDEHMQRIRVLNRDERLFSWN